MQFLYALSRDKINLPFVSKAANSPSLVFVLDISVQHTACDLGTGSLHRKALWLSLAEVRVFRKWLRASSGLFEVVVVMWSWMLAHLSFPQV